MENLVECPICKQIKLVKSKGFYCCHHYWETDKNLSKLNEKLAHHKKNGNGEIKAEPSVLPRSTPLETNENAHQTPIFPVEMKVSDEEKLELNELLEEENDRKNQ